MWCDISDDCKGFGGKCCNGFCCNDIYFNEIKNIECMNDDSCKVKIWDWSLNIIGQVWENLYKNFVGDKSYVLLQYSYHEILDYHDIMQINDQSNSLKHLAYIIIKGNVNHILLLYKMLTWSTNRPQLQ